MPEKKKVFKKIHTEHGVVFRIIGKEDNSFLCYMGPRFRGHSGDGYDLSSKVKDRELNHCLWLDLSSLKAVPKMTEEFRQGFKFGQSWTDRDGESTGTAEQAWDHYQTSLK
jgi:hypothetical protein